MSTTLDLERRIDISRRLERYLRALDRVETATKELADANRMFRQSLPQQSRFVANVSFEYYLVTSERDGNFKVEQIDTL